MAEHGDYQVKYRMLGPLRIDFCGQSAVPSAPKLRMLLTLLLFNANRPIATPVLLKELWGENPPASAMNTLQTYVFQLRKWLADSCGSTPDEVGRDLLVTDVDGYALRVRRGELDVHLFEEQALEGSRTLAAGEHAAAASLLRVALELWRGPIVTDFQPERGIQAHITRLEERHLYVLEQRIEADLNLNLHQELVSELASLVVEHRLHETLHAKLMIALHRSGRTSGALDVFRRLREEMVDQLGIEPSFRLQALHRAILSGTRLLDWAPGRGGVRSVLDLIAASG
ncbi:AfsR/SARP family transcriptional regulator [Amycolatopsis panacis]|uniref:AfsR/SARP family transcriptional regulator n=1 Tax=Amycolatopsis panacis TaxID=2340917 RepID=UPI001314D243|nr:AfsR/SARP family transcriptional regulator [Amycolatopsis panacis]